MQKKGTSCQKNLHLRVVFERRQFRFIPIIEFLARHSASDMFE